ncbi:MAG: ankyrin repeat domain-containing protein [Alphaproteobacteria bacterium]|nr:ankyrin repeat domain-containing protein [Alphaproteobacteria bacterium]
MKQKESVLNSFFSENSIRKPLSQIKDKKKCLEEVNNLLSTDFQFQIFKKIIMALFQKEEELLLEIKKLQMSSLGSLNNIFCLIEQYKMILRSLISFEDDVFIASVLKETKSSYKAVFSDLALKMRERIMKKMEDSLVQDSLKRKHSKINQNGADENKDSFEVQVKNQKKFFNFQKKIDLCFLTSVDFNKKYKRVSDIDECFYVPFYSDEMYQSLLKLIQEKVNKIGADTLLKNWETDENAICRQNFFKEVFCSALIKRYEFLSSETYNMMFKEEKSLKQKLLKEKETFLKSFSAEEKNLLQNRWDEFSSAVLTDDFVLIDTLWDALNNDFEFIRVHADSYFSYFEVFAQNKLFIPCLKEKNLPLNIHDFLFVFDSVLDVEKKHLKKFLKFILKNLLVLLMPFVSSTVLKDALKQMQKCIKDEVDLVEENLFFLYQIQLKKLNEATSFIGEKTADQTDLHQKDIEKIKGVDGSLKSLNLDVNMIDFKGRTPLFEAVCAENIEMVKKLLSLNADVEKSDYKGQTPLMMAFENGNDTLIELLLQNKASLFVKDFRLKTMMHFAVKSQKKEGVLRLIESNVDINAADLDGQTPLHFAVQANNLEAFKLLLAKGANPYLLNKKKESVIALIQEKDEFKDIFVAYEQDKKIYECLLFQGILKNNLSFVQKAIEKNAHLNEIYLYGQTPIEMALTVLNREIINVLMKNRCFLSTRRITNLGYFALRQALVQQDIKYFKLLLKAGADQNGIEPQTGHTLLHQAVLLGYSSFIKVLLENNANVHIKDLSGQTVLDLVAKTDDVEIKSFF